MEKYKSPDQSWDYYRIALHSSAYDISQAHKYADEKVIRDMILSRDPRTLQHIIDSFAPEKAGRMSENPFLQMLFLCVSWITILTRNCIDAGMPEVQAYTISDIYLRQLSLSMTIDQLYQWQRIAAATFIDTLPPLGNKHEKVDSNEFSKVVNSAINHILHHLEASLKLNTVAATLHISPDYLSAAFKKETGVTFTQFVKQQKIGAAKEILKNTTLSIVEIASSLSFSNQSYFCKVFKEETGMSPITYRNLINDISARSNSSGELN